MEPQPAESRTRPPERYGRPLGIGVLDWSTTEWFERAGCAGEDPEVFFPLGTTPLAMAQLRTAKSICSRCPVRTECLQWALETNQATGVWGGLSEEERRGRG
jgi:WhiB family transcriptional regulator, redox-sensing transcriptional regulator